MNRLVPRGSEMQHPVSYTHLDAHDEEAIVFHALTAGNPRVQSYCLEQSGLTIRERLASLGPGGMTVESQIANQLAKAVERLQDFARGITGIQINSICTVSYTQLRVYKGQAQGACLWHERKPMKTQRFAWWEPLKKRLKKMVS